MRHYNMEMYVLAIKARLKDLMEEAISNSSEMLDVDVKRVVANYIDDMIHDIFHDAIMAARQADADEKAAINANN